MVTKTPLIKSPNFISPSISDTRMIFHYQQMKSVSFCSFSLIGFPCTKIEKVLGDIYTDISQRFTTFQSPM